ncbi:murein transglycosylase [Enterovibrio norvegicus]|uniref:transglycosylase SLT domain-containing protein n=1 Tax=Enterovibrio norvegicus TaxID=188144 RepID=UPI000C826364|nr:transglycosylase SLT domain-containing protein [Enterovibrio norvegicus]MCC4800613.1 transglycosylase SLT domain-containing protein [Enterovibrio norvegicus]PMI38600.1 murein transglycosylase [Enterovibrio norvegicus]PMN51867.1 murein transglycosylase [Enterovibrio norvegicus]
MSLGRMKIVAACIAAVLSTTSVLSTNVAYASDSFDELERESKRVNMSQSEKKAQFHEWLDAYLSEYEAWREAYTKDIDQQRETLIDQWGSGELSDQTKHVEYAKDNTVKKVVDYENNTAVVSVLVDADGNVDQSTLPKDKIEIDGQVIELTKAEKRIDVVDYSAEQEKKEKAFIVDHVYAQMQELDVQAERLIRSGTGVPDSFIYERAHNKKLELLASAKTRIEALSAQFKQKRLALGIPEPVVAVINTPTSPAKPEAKPAVKPTVVAEKPVKETTVVVAKTESTDVAEVAASTSAPAIAGKAVEVKKPVDAEKAVVAKKPVVEPSVVAEKPAVAAKPEKKIVSYTVKLPENALKSRASTFQPLVEKESERWDVEAALVMAIMHSESSFRPDAKSHVPAYGLMQVVPTSAGHDVNKQVHNIDAPMKADDLYVPPFNVEAGTAYLNILNTRYLRSITNEESRMYCVIAAYNTGAGNVARAFNADRSTNIRKAAHMINAMTPDEVYEHMINNLPYDETKNYLKKVSGRIALY